MTGDQSVTETSTTTLTTDNTPMPPVGFEPPISAGEGPKTYVLDRAATGTEIVRLNCVNIMTREKLF